MTNHLATGALIAVMYSTLLVAAFAVLVRIWAA